MAGEKWRGLFKGLFRKNTGDKKGGVIPTLLLLGTAGIAIMLLGSVFQPSSLPTNRSPATTDKSSETTLASRKNPNTMDEYEAMYEKELKENLGNISGVGQVSVMVNIDSSEELVVDKNRNQSNQTTKESDNKGATRENTTQSNQDQTVMAGNQPVVLKTIRPKIRGVMVVAEGANNLQVKAWILEAVERVLGVPSYKISILPKKG